MIDSWMDCFQMRSCTILCHRCCKSCFLCQNTLSTGNVPDKTPAEKIQKKFDLRPFGIINMLNLQSQQYYLTAKNGHFGDSTESCSWDQINMVNEILNDVGT